MQKLSSVLIFPLISMSKIVKESKRHRTKPKELPVTLILSHGHDKLSKGTIARPTKTVIYIGLCMVRVQIWTSFEDRVETVNCQFTFEQLCFVF